MNEPEKIIPGGYTDFLNYLDTVTTEEALFSRLTYWFANQNTADDARDRFDVVADRAKELKLWNGLDHFQCLAPFFVWCLIGIVGCWYSGNL